MNDMLLEVTREAETKGLIHQEIPPAPIRELTGRISLFVTATGAVMMEFLMPAEAVDMLGADRVSVVYAGNWTWEMTANPSGSTAVRDNRVQASARVVRPEDITPFGRTEVEILATPGHLTFGLKPGARQPVSVIHQTRAKARGKKDAPAGSETGRQIDQCHNSTGGTGTLLSPVSAPLVMDTENQTETLIRLRNRAQEVLDDTLERCEYPPPQAPVATAAPKAMTVDEMRDLATHAINLLRQVEAETPWRLIKSKVTGDWKFVADPIE